MEEDENAANWKSLSTSRARIEDSLTLLQSRSPPDPFADFHRGPKDVITAAAIKQSAASTRLSLWGDLDEKTAAIDWQIQELDRLEEDLMGMDAAEIERLRKLAKEASERHMSPEDTDIVEEAIATLIALEKLRLLLEDRQRIFSLCSARYEWEKQRQRCWTQYCDLSHRLQVFVTSARWAVTSKTEVFVAPSLVEGSQDTTSSEDLAQLQDAFQTITSDLQMLSQVLIPECGEALDFLIDQCKCPESFLDEQDCIEELANGLTSCLEFAREILEQRRACGQLSGRFKTLRKTSTQLLSWTADAKIRLPDTSTASRLTTEGNSLTHQMADICGSSVRPFFQDISASVTRLHLLPHVLPSFPTHQDWPQQQDCNRLVEDHLTAQLHSTSKAVRSALSEVASYVRAEEAYSGMVTSIARLEEATSQLSQLTSRCAPAADGEFTSQAPLRLLQAALAADVVRHSVDVQGESALYEEICASMTAVEKQLGRDALKCFQEGVASESIKSSADVCLLKWSSAKASAHRSLTDAKELAEALAAVIRVSSRMKEASDLVEDQSVSLWEQCQREYTAVNTLQAPAEVERRSNLQLDSLLDGVKTASDNAEANGVLRRHPDLQSQIQQQLGSLNAQVNDLLKLQQWTAQIAQQRKQFLEIQSDFGDLQNQMTAVLGDVQMSDTGFAKGSQSALNALERLQGEVAAFNQAMQHNLSLLGEPPLLSAIYLAAPLLATDEHVKASCNTWSLVLAQKLEKLQQALQESRQKSSSEFALSAEVDIIRTHEEPSGRSKEAIESMRSRLNALVQVLTSGVVERQTVEDGTPQLQTFLDLPTAAEASEQARVWKSLNSEALELSDAQLTHGGDVEELEKALEVRSKKMTRFVQLAIFASAASHCETLMASHLDLLDAHVAPHYRQDSSSPCPSPSILQQRLTKTATASGEQPKSPDQPNQPEKASDGGSDAGEDMASRIAASLKNLQEPLLKAQAAASVVDSDIRVRRRLRELRRTHTDMIDMGNTLLDPEADRSVSAMSGISNFTEDSISLCPSATSSPQTFLSRPLARSTASSRIPVPRQRVGSDHSQPASSRHPASLNASQMPVLRTRKISIPAQTPRGPHGPSEGHTRLPSVEAAPRTPNAKVPRQSMSPVANHSHRAPLTALPLDGRRPRSALQEASTSCIAPSRNARGTDRYQANPNSKLDIAVGKMLNRMPVPVKMLHASQAPQARSSDIWQDDCGRYWVGYPNPKLCFCRILRSGTIMVRVAGGWEEITRYIMRHCDVAAIQDSKSSTLMTEGTKTSPERRIGAGARHPAQYYGLEGGISTPVSLSRHTSPEASRNPGVIHTPSRSTHGGEGSSTPSPVLRRRANGQGTNAQGPASSVPYDQSFSSPISPSSQSSPQRAFQLKAPMRAGESSPTVSLHVSRAALGSPASPTALALPLRGAGSTIPLNSAGSPPWSSKSASQILTPPPRGLGTSPAPEEAVDQDEPDSVDMDELLQLLPLFFRPDKQAASVGRVAGSPRVQRGR